jgi:integrase/recombinase XerD
MTGTLETLFQLFKRERMYLKNVTSKTVCWYECSWKAFAPFLANGNADDASDIQQRVRNAVIALAERGKLKASSINDYIRAMRAFLNWLHAENHIQKSIRIDRLTEHKKVRESLSVEAVERLISFKPKRDSEKRVHLMSIVIIDTGLRLTEVRNLRTTDIDLDNMVLVVECGKGRKMRLVPFSENLRRSLYRYIRDLKPGEHVFRTRTGSVLSPRNALRDLNKLARRAGIGRIGWHVLRHTMATMYLRSGGNVAYLRRILGHSSIQTTMVYEHLQIEDLTKEHQRHSPLAGHMRR